MKYLLAFILLISLSVRAENVIQFSGGNYIYAEQGRLIFNLEPNVFKARNWTYDAAQDAAVSDFAVNLPLKTKYTSNWYGYEVMNKSNFHYAAYNPYYNDNIQNIIRPVYMKKAFLPAVAWGIRIAGLVGRSVVPPLVTKCLTNNLCRSTLASLGLHCAFNYATGLFYNLPGGVCEKAEKDGFKKNENGEYVKDTKLVITSAVAGGGGEISTSFSQYRDFSSVPESELLNHCKKGLAKDFVSVKIEKSSINSHMKYCGYYKADGYGPASNLIESKKVNNKEQLTMVDIENFVSDDFKDNPNDYINGIPGIKNNGDIEDGTGMLPAVEITAARIEKKELGGSFSVIGSEPYRDHKTGQTLQDMVTISNAQKDSNAKPSGSKNSGSAAGTSTSYNNVSVTTINRSDVESTTSEGKPNNPNGTTGSGSSSGSGSGSGTGTGEGEDGEEKGNCKEGDKTVGCMPVGDLPEVFGDGENDGFSVPTHEVGQLSFDNFLNVTATCPQPEPISIGSHTFEIDWTPACYFAEKIRGLIKLIGALMAASIIFRRT